LGDSVHDLIPAPINLQPPHPNTLARYVEGHSSPRFLHCLCLL
jgi:hypothetical protein